MSDSDLIETEQNESVEPAESTLTSAAPPDMAEGAIAEVVTAPESAIAEVVTAPESAPAETRAASEASVASLPVEGLDNATRAELAAAVTAIGDPDQPLLDIRAQQQRRPSIWALAAAGAVEVEADSTGGPMTGGAPSASEPGSDAKDQAADEDWTHAQALMDEQEVFETRVTGHNQGGVTVNVGRLRGFIPNSHLSMIQAEMDAEQQQNELSKLVGKMIPVRVIEVQRKRRRLVLSERLAERAWRDKQRDRILGELQAGQRVKGRVRSLTSFGVFVDIGGADGLIHLSELTHKRIKHPREVVKVGQELELEVIRVERERGRVGLSLKNMQSDPWADIEARYRPGQLITARVTNLVTFGAFATVEPGVEGLVHISELSDDYVEHPRQVVQRGQDYTMRVLAIDREHERVSLSLRQAPQWIEAPGGAASNEDDAHDG